MYFPEIYVIITVHLYIETVKDRTSALSKRKHSFTGDIILDSSKTVEIRQEVSDIEKLYDASDKLVAEIEKVVIGKRDVIVMLMTALLASGHVLIEDVPGVGKTTLAAALAKAAGLSYKRAQFTPDVMASDITGFNIYNQKEGAFEFREGLVMCNILLADEINRASPKTQSSLLEAMEEKRVTVDGKTYDIPDPFIVIATENPTGFVGTYPLPEAQLDRFAVKLRMGYPSMEEELRIIGDRRESSPLDSVKPAATRDMILDMRSACEQVYIAPALYKYIVLLVSATRRHPKLSLGASPRASIVLMKTAQAYAFMHRRDYVIPEDIASIYRTTVSHRLILSQEAKIARVDTNAVLHETAVPFDSGEKQVFTKE